MVQHLLTKGVGSVTISSRDEAKQDDIDAVSETLASASFWVTCVTTTVSRHHSLERSSFSTLQRAQAGAVVRVLPAAGSQDQRDRQP